MNASVNIDKQFTVNSEEGWQQFLEWARAFYEEHKYVTFAKPRIGKDRTVLQNDFSFEAYDRIAKQLYGGDIEHARFECKLNIGCPILSGNDEEFRHLFHFAIAPLPYCDRLKAMKYLPVTRLMTRKQFKEYTRMIDRTYSSKGVHFGDLFDEKVA